MSPNDNARLYVSPLPVDMDLAVLRDVFGKFGTVVEAHIFPRRNGPKDGGAFVVMDSPENAERAITHLHQRFIFEPSVRLQVKHARSNSRGKSENKVFLGSLPTTITEEDVRRVFKKCGDVEEVHCMAPSSVSKECCAFVRFSSEEAVNKALALNGKCLFSRKRRCLVKPANPDHNSNKQQQAPPQPQPQPLPLPQQTQPPPQQLPGNPEWGPQWVEYGPSTCYAAPYMPPWPMWTPPCPPPLYPPMMCPQEVAFAYPEPMQRRTPESVSSYGGEKTPSEAGSQSACEGDTCSESSTPRANPRSKECSTSKIFEIRSPSKNFEWGLDEDSWLLGTPLSKENRLRPTFTSR